MPRISEQEMLAYVQEQERTSIGYSTDQLTNERDEALWRYLGMPYGDEVEGRSQAISMDSSQVIDWALPDLLEPFVSGGQVVQFEPTRKSEEAAAKRATQYVNWLFSVDNPGFEILHSAAKDGLIQKLGVTKILWDERERTTEQTLTGQSSLDLARLEGDADVEIVETTAEDVPLTELDRLAIANGLPAPTLQMFPDGKQYIIELKRTDEDGRIDLETVPPEEFRIASRASSSRQPSYIGHTTPKTKGEIIEMGFKEELVKDAADTDYGIKEGKNIRFYNQPARYTMGQQHEGPDWRGQWRWLHEEYVPYDWDGDGDIEIIQIFRIGNTILDMQEVTCDPFACFTPFPLPHSVIGQSMVDKVRQTQRVKTVLTRNMLDNIYLATNPQREVPEDAVTDDGATYDDLLSFRVGGLVRTKKPGMLREMAVPDRSSTALAGLQHMDIVREKESGVVPGAVGSSAEDVDKTGPITADESQRRARLMHKRTRLMMRVFAEMYLCPLFSKILKFVVAHQNKAREVKISGEWVEMDPRPWNTEMNAVAAVGLGHETAEEEATAAVSIAQAQRELAGMGMVREEHAWKTFTDLTAAWGKRFPEDYAIDPTTQAGRDEIDTWKKAQAAAQPQQADPAVIRAENDGQLKAAKLQQDGMFRQAELQQKAQLAAAEADMKARIEMAKVQMQTQSDEAKAQAGFAADMEKIRADHAADVAKINADMEAKIRQQDIELDLTLRQQNIEALLAQRQQISNETTGGNGLDRVRPGGEVG